LGSVHPEPSGLPRFSLGIGTGQIMRLRIVTKRFFSVKSKVLVNGYDKILRKY
jgi:hypothetical protein